MMKDTGINWILAYALEHLERDYEDIVDRIATVRRELGRPPEGEPLVVQASVESVPVTRRVKVVPAVVKRAISETTRRRMIRAQQRRWQAHRRELAQAA